MPRPPHVFCLHSYGLCSPWPSLHRRCHGNYYYIIFLTFCVFSFDCQLLIPHGWAMTRLLQSLCVCVTHTHTQAFAQRALLFLVPLLPSLSSDLLYCEEILTLAAAGALSRQIHGVDITRRPLGGTIMLAALLRSHDMDKWRTRGDGRLHLSHGLYLANLSCRHSVFQMLAACRVQHG